MGPRLDHVWDPRLGASGSAPGFVIAGEAQQELTLGGAHIPPGEFVASFDAEGAVRWAHPVAPDGPLERMRIERVLVAPSGDTVVITEASGHRGPEDPSGRVGVLRFDPRGAPIWTKHYAGWLGDRFDLGLRAEAGSGDQFGALDGEATYLWYFPCDDPEGCNAVVVRLDARGEEQWRTVVVEADRINDSPGLIGAAHLGVGPRGDLYAFAPYENGVRVNGRLQIWLTIRGAINFWGAGALFVAVTPAGKVPFYREFESDRHGIFVDGLVAGDRGRIWLTGTFSRFIGFDIDSQESVASHGMLRPPGADPVSNGVQFLAAFDGDGRFVDAFPVAFGSDVAMAAGRDGALYVTTRYHGDLLLPGLQGRYRYTGFGCAVVEIR